MVLRIRSQVKGLLGQGHEIFRVGVKLINSRELKVSSRSAAFCASYLRTTMGGGVHPTPLHMRGSMLPNALIGWYLFDMVYTPLKARNEPSLGCRSLPPPSLHRPWLDFCTHAPTMFQPFLRPWGDPPRAGEGSQSSLSSCKRVWSYLLAVTD